MNYKKEIAIKLIEKYNKTSNLNSITKTTEIFKNYKNDIEIYDCANKIIAEMKKEKLINVVTSANKITSEIVALSICNEDALKTLSDIANLKLKTNFYNDLYRILEEFKAKTDNIEVYYFCEEQQKNISIHKSINIAPFSQEKYFENLQNAKDILVGCEEILNLKEDVLLRNFSETVYHDSKRFEKIYKNILKIIDENFECNEESCEDMLKKWHILKNPSFIQIKGDCCISFLNNESFSLDNFGTPLGLTKDYIDNIKSIETAKVITIENLTTFNSYVPNKNELVVFTSGYAEDLIIKLLNSVSVNADVVHFGDIDAHGFRIAHNIFERINKPVKLFKMDLETITLLYRYNDTKSLNENNRELLKNMIKDKKYSEQEKEVFKFMIKNNCMAEQEAVKLVS